MITTTHLVETLLRDEDDFLTLDQIMDRTGRAKNRVAAALFHLERVGVVATLDDGYQRYWFILPPEEDKRSGSIVEREEETRPRHRRSNKE